ncbi:NAD(P)-dependent oxidoreductase [Butyricicoccus sp. OF10-2]|uniref:NAD(P)-dependent oxidoreductase n=1 Tax=Butyricicoccus sp. OF10-2 TaxID=2292298 RepID=UPI000E5CCFCB|nr:NAD(P)-dependent oxidoreductase [Butyricicoccus sp. OF10-2]RHV83190.1 NAD(P)-dependent oxidoreductase [Butyricicoccus sp. OF10-2]
MRTVGVIGLGNMGMGIAKNLLKAGFTTRGYDLFEAKREELRGYGGVPCFSPAEVGDGAEVVFVMVMNGAQALDVAFGENGLCKTMKPGSVLFLTATIGMGYAQQLAKGLQEYGIEMIDSGVSGGLSGAHNGTLTLMASGKKEVYDSCKDVMDAIASNPNHVGTEPGQGQVVKSCLQALIGAEFTATFELLVMGAKAGVDPQILLDVIGTSGGGCGVFKNCVPLIMDRKFKDTGSAITTMSKDLNITMDLAREVGCYMPTTASARELFMAGLTRYPDEDNWSITKILEEIAGVQVKRK